MATGLLFEMFVKSTHAFLSKGHGLLTLYGLSTVCIGCPVCCAMHRFQPIRVIFFVGFFFSEQPVVVNVYFHTHMNHTMREV